MKKKLNMRERILSLIIVVSLPLVYFSILYKQQSDKIQNLRSSVISQQADLSAKKTTLTDLSIKAALAKKTMNANTEISHYLEANEHMSNLLRKLGADQQDRGMSLKKISITESKKLNSLYQSSINVEVESSFEALGNFLGSLSDNQTLIDVKSVVLNRIDNELKRCTATIEVEGYYHEGPKL